MTNVTESTLLVPVIQRTQGDCPQGLNPANPLAHHYALLQVSGDAGPTLSLAVESVGLNGKLLAPRGQYWPPTLLSDRIDDLAMTGQQPSVHSLTAYRLASNPTNQYYNYYLSDPFVLVREALSTENTNDLPVIPGRQALWSGDFVRVSLDPSAATPALLAPYAGQIQNAALIPGLSRSYPAYPGDYTQNPNPSLPSAPVVGGVDLQSGEFSTAATDIYVTGRTQPLVLSRSYKSRSQYYGPFGRGWDFNWNARIKEVPASYPSDLCLLYYGNTNIDLKARPSDAVLVDGSGGYFFFQRIADGAGNTNQLSFYSLDPAISAFGWTNLISDYYVSPAGEFSALYKFTDGSWAMVDPAGIRTYFRPDGRLDRVIGAYAASSLICNYRDDGKLDSVSGDRGYSLRFGYYAAPGDLDSTAYDPNATNSLQIGLIAKVQILGPEGIPGEVDFSYDTFGDLRQATSLGGTNTYYGYDAQPPHQLTSIGRGDGARYPAQTITYTNGMVQRLAQDTRSLSFTGAASTAADRYAATNATLTVTAGTDAPAQFGVDNRGRPTLFANLPQGADDAGRLNSIADANTKATLVYDTNNPVHRFQGNLTSTAQVGRPDFKTAFVYDGSAWNRLVSRTSAEGVVTTNTYVLDGAQTYVAAMVEVSGSVQRTNLFDSFGQLQEEDSADGDHVLTKKVIYSLDHLATGEQLGDTQNYATLTGGGLVGISAVGISQLQYTNQYNPDNQLLAMAPATGTGPAVALAYTNGFIASDVVGDGGSTGISNTYVYDALERSKIHSVTTSETGLPDSVTQYSYDAQGRLSYYEVNGERTTVTWDGVLATGLDGPGVSRTVAYTNGLPISVTEQGLTMALGYDGEKRVTNMVQPGSTTAFTYNSGNQMASKTVTDDSGATLLDESYTYDGAGRLETTTAAGDVRKLEYFADGRIRRVYLDDLLVREVTRDAAGVVTEISIPEVMDRIFTNPDQATGIRTNEELRLYPSGGGGSFFSYTVNATYDLHGRQTSQQRPCGTWTYAYDTYGNLTKRTDPDGVSVGGLFSPAGLVLTNLFSDGTSAQYTYDANRRIQSVGGMAGVGGVQNTLNSQDHLVEQVVWPDGATTVFLDRNEFFEPETVNHGGVHQSLTWTDGRLTDIAAGADSMSYDYDGFGRPIEIDLNNSKLKLEYDVRGQLTSEQVISSTSDTPDRKWEAGFGNHNRATNETYPSQFQISWNPNDFGLPTSSPEAGIANIDWMGPGMLSAVTFQSGLRIGRGYDASLRNVSQQYLTGPINRPVTNAAFLYALSPGGRVLSETRVHEGRTDVYKRNSNLLGMRITDFLFSATNRTTGEGAEAAVKGLSYDANGELSAPLTTSGSDERAVQVALSLANGKIQTADGFAVAYNLDGSVSQAPLYFRLPGATGLTAEAATLTYDGFGMLQTITRGAGADTVTITYTRDGMGRIIRRDVTGPATRCRPGSREYFWKGNQLLEEYVVTPATNALVRRYIWLGSDLVMIQVAPSLGVPLVNYVPLVGLNGSIGGYLNMDGTIAETIVYGAYGTPVFRGADGAEAPESAIGQTLLFQGAWFDEDAGLYQVGARNLHPVFARFLQRDPRLYTVSRALYTAYNGDPAGMIDPSGALPEEIEKLKDLQESFEDLGGKAQKFDQALLAVRNWEPRKETALAKTGLDLTKSMFSLAAKNSGDNFAQFAKTVTANFDTIKNGLDLVQSVLDMRKDRLVLTAIRANTTPFGDYSFTTRWLAVGGSLSDYQQLDGNFFAQKAVQASREVIAQEGPGAAYRYYRKAHNDYILQREGNLLSAGQNGLKLGSALFEYLYKDDKTYGAELGRKVLQASGMVLTAADKLRSFQGEYTLAKLGAYVEKAAITGDAESLMGKFNNLQAAFNFGFKTGQRAVLAFTDPDVAKAYADNVKLFESSGGFTSVFGGVLAWAGAERASYVVQRYADHGAYGAFVQPYIDSLNKPDPRLEFYQRGLNAP